MLLTLLGSACSGSSTDATRDVVLDDIQVTMPAPTVEPYVFRTSASGAITVHGTMIVLDPMTIVPAPNDSIFLVEIPADQPIAGIPQFTEGTVPQADVDERVGEFIFTDIQPGQYAVVVITLGGAQIPARFQTTQTYAIFTLESSQVDTTVEIGNLTLP